MKYLTKEWFQKMQTDNNSPYIRKAIKDCNVECKDIEVFGKSPFFADMQ